MQKQDTADTIFNADFETTDLGQWTMNVNDAGDLSASTSADYWGLQGLSAVIDDNTAIYVQDDSPANETEYRTRFYVNPNNITMATGDFLDLFTGRNGTSDVLRIQLQKTATSYQIRAGLLPDGTTTWTDTSWYDVPNAWSAVEIQYQAFAYSGSLTLWLDDVQKQSLTFIDNDTRTILDIRLGAQGIETGTRGTIYFDDFESRRFSYIGTLPDPGVNDPQATNQPGWQASTYQYSPSVPHAVTSVAIENGGTNTYEYDLNGNMTCRAENGITYKQTYNAENRISTIQKLASGTCAAPGNLSAKWDFTYDGDGTRTATLYTPYVSGQPQTAVLTAYYMGGAYEVTGSAVKKYYSIAGIMVAVNDGTAVQYLLTDHLGSTVAVTNSSGTLTSQQRYLPFGEARSIPNSPIAGTDFTYTGQRMLDSGMGGIMDYKARFYDPYLNRFLQPDSLIPNPADPQYFNRFSYVLNNPIIFRDPSGHISVWCESDPNSSPCLRYVHDQRLLGATMGGGANDPVELTDDAEDLLEFSESVGLSPWEIIQLGMVHEVAGWAYDSESVKLFSQHVANRFVWYSRNNCNSFLTNNCMLNFFMATYQAIRTSFVKAYSGSNAISQFIFNESTNWGETYHIAGEYVMQHFWGNVDPSYDPDHNFEDWDEPFNVGVVPAEALETALGGLRPVVGIDFLVVTESICPAGVRSYSLILSYSGTKLFEGFGLQVAC